MAIDDSQATPAERASLRNTSALILAAGGLAAAFGAASCCALPLLLGSLGVGSAWLVAVAWVAAPHRLALLLAAVICLISAGGVFVLRSLVSACTPGMSCGRLATTALLVCMISLGAVLAVLGYLYA
jgi:mercuric ion transport protein